MRRAADVGTCRFQKSGRRTSNASCFLCRAAFEGVVDEELGENAVDTKRKKVGDVISQGVKAFFFRVFYAIFRGKRGRPLDFRGASGYPKEDELSQKPDLSETLGDAVKSRLRAVNSAVFEILIW
jgi:hypothetical protein